MGDAAIIFLLFLFFGGIFIMRLVGAWMLRINDVISELQQIKAILKSQQNAQSPPLQATPPEIKKTDYV